MDNYTIHISEKSKYPPGQESEELFVREILRVD